MSKSERILWTILAISCTLYWTSVLSLFYFGYTTNAFVALTIQVLMFLCFNWKRMLSEVLVDEDYENKFKIGILIVAFAGFIFIIMPGMVAPGFCEIVLNQERRTHFRKKMNEAFKFPPALPPMPPTPKFIKNRTWLISAAKKKHNQNVKIIKQKLAVAARRCA